MQFFLIKTLKAHQNCTNVSQGLRRRALRTFTSSPTIPAKFSEKSWKRTRLGTTEKQTKTQSTDQRHESGIHRFTRALERGRLKMRDWNYRHHQKCRGGKCRTGNIGTNLQGWKMRDQAVMESQTPACYGTHDMIYLIFLLVFCCIILCKCHLIL